jgi:hypothetical protein
MVVLAALWMDGQAADALNRLPAFCVSSAEQAAHGTVQADRF